MNAVTIIGGGLAGCECAAALARHGIKVKLYDMKPQRMSPAHHSPDLGELVCSNSLKAERLGSASGLLKAEMTRFGSVSLECARATRVPAGGALAVDREQFARLMTLHMEQEPLIQVIREELKQLPEEGVVVVATGPLTAEPLTRAIVELCGEAGLSFHDAAAPIVACDSLNMDRAFFAARYGRGDDDYINCPMEKDEYEAFVEALTEAEGVELKPFEKEHFRVYEGCMPIEVMAGRGADTLRFGPLRPVGLTDPHTGKRPYAVVQLRKENREGTLYNIVGFQTNLKFGEQKRVFSMVPGLERAHFVRYGVMHRNTFIQSPKLLDIDFSLKKDKRIYFAGQITGVEGYMESAAIGILAGENIARRFAGQFPLDLPRTTMLGALSRHVYAGNRDNFQPMGANMGLLPPLEQRIKGKAERYEAIARRAIADMDLYLQEEQISSPGR